MLSKRRRHCSGTELQMRRKWTTERVFWRFLQNSQWRCRHDMASTFNFRIVSAAVRNQLKTISAFLLPSAIHCTSCGYRASQMPLTY